MATEEKSDYCHCHPLNGDVTVEAVLKYDDCETHLECPKCGKVLLEHFGDLVFDLKVKATFTEQGDIVIENLS